MGNVDHIPQQRVWTRNLFVIFASLLLFFNTLSLLPWGIYHARSFLHTDNHPTSQFSSSIASLETVDIGQLQGGEDIASVLKAAADILGAVSAQHHLTSLQALSNDLHKLAVDTHQAQSGNNLKTRGLFDGFASILTGGAAGGAGGAAGAGGAKAATGGGGLAGIFETLGGKLLDVTADSLATPAGFLGDGVGRGATTGLKINNGVKQTTAEKPSGVNAIAANLGFGASNALTGTLDTSSFLTGAGAASSALGTGLGGGTASGLGLNKSAVAAPNGTGIPLIAGNLGNGLTQSLFSNIDMSKLMTGLPSGMLQSAVVNAGKGLGEGAAEGLDLPMNMATMRMRLKRAAAAAAGTNTTGSGLNVNEIAYGFTKSLSSSFLGAVDVKKLTSQAMSGSNLTSMVGPTLVGAGSGLGAGAAQGLGLSNAAVAPSTGADAAAPEVAHNFAYELTTSFLANGTLSSLQSKLMSAMSMTNISAMLGPAAQGAGSGIGQGAAVGLGLQDPSTAQSPMGGDVAMVARDFSYGLTSNFLANGTVSRLQAKAAALLGGGSNSSSGTMMSALQKVSVSKAAEGLARGLVDGAGQSVANMGGFQAILNGANSSDVMMQAATPIFKSDDFNDTTGGVATSFGQGLGGQGVTLIAQMLGMSMSLSSNGILTPSTMENNSTTPASLSSPETPANNLSTPAIRARSYRSFSSIIRKSAPLISPFPNLHKRVDDPTNLNISDITSGLLTGVNVTSLDVLLQKGVDTLTCQGIGGFVEIFQGLKASGSIPATGGSVMLPNATFTVASQGNEFLINPATQVILVNGIGISRLTILIVAHAFLLILAYFLAIPLALLLTSGHEIATMLSLPHIWASAPKTRFRIWIFAVLPLSLGGGILGILLLGSASHGTTFHGLLGFAVLVLTIVAFVLEMKFLPGIEKLKLLRGIVLSVLLAAANAAFVTGFVDIQRISLCTVRLPDQVLIGAAMNAASLFTTGTTVVAVKMRLEKWMKGKKGGSGSASASVGFNDMEKSGFETEEKEKVSLKERIRGLRG
ncbi:uncharacterized protein EAF02_003164 [Botrytis sinoallii]|uniref:uncharacterized protein n=1 Tax=Botrytis sinoallii TaxID=1463999 RepID=UPI001900616C|nr:uncharacterized protein EAF02_003164 [Botrytis sinoallii]KAF7888623.1 hypothetical protein EAF02_003164 [Botrytis sinoallii]